MYHSLIFAPVTKELSALRSSDLYDNNGKPLGVNTYDDWFLIPETRPVFNPPELKYVSVDQGGVDGELDLTEVLTGRPTYKNRTGSITFLVENDHKRWSTIYQKIANHLHGKRFRAILEDDPAYFYEGRFTVNQWKSDKWWSSIVIDYNVKPYKYEMLMSDEPWLWDPFSFETGIIRNYSGITVNGSKTITVYGSPMLVCPRFVVSGIPSGATLNVTHGGHTETLQNGDNNVFADIVIPEGISTMTFVETGNSGDTHPTVAVQYRGGWL